MKMKDFILFFIRKLLATNKVLKDALALVLSFVNPAPFRDSDWVKRVLLSDARSGIASFPSLPASICKIILK